MNPTQCLQQSTFWVMAQIATAAASLANTGFPVEEHITHFNCTVL